MNQNEAAVRALWTALAARDWDALKARLSEDAFYEDVPTPDRGARGREAIVRRLRIAFDELSGYEHTLHRIACAGASVFVEHTELWRFKSGEQAQHTFVSVHEVREGKVSLWRDYWDVGHFVGQFPKWFTEKLAAHAGEEFGA